MNDPLVIVGAGASAVHAAQTALELRRRVIMLDVGRIPPESPLPMNSLNALKSNLVDPVGFFLGDGFESLILPSTEREYYGFPPSKAYVFEETSGLEYKAEGFHPLFSYAAGGLAEAWTAGSYPFSERELEAFPFGWAEIAPAYGEVAHRIGVSGVTDDDLAPFIPAHDGLLPPIALDSHSAALLESYTRNRERIGRSGMVLGRSRVATLSIPHLNRPACSLCGRCLWGCPTAALYTPALTLEHCRRYSDFTYLNGIRVDRFDFNDANCATHVHAVRLNTGERLAISVGTLVLAAGALNSARILLQSLLHNGSRVELTGLMDNRQVLMPFVNVSRIGMSFDAESYQYNLLAIGLPGALPFDYVHGLMTTMKTALIHPIAQTLPIFGIRAATALFRNLHAGLGMVNINFPDTPRAENRVTLESPSSGGRPRLMIKYAPTADEPERIGHAVKRFRSFLLELRCLAPQQLTRIRPMGASVHYAGLMPMQVAGGDFTTDRAGRCRPFSNVLVGDGAALPALPAKNLTFTLMANATRIIRENFAV